MRNQNIKLSEVENWIKKQDTYNLFKQVRRKFPRLPILVDDIDEQWQIDLMDMTLLSKSNDKYKYLLNIIDCLSRYAWSLPLRTKSAIEVEQSLENLFKKRKPRKIQSDQGKEFVNSRMVALCNKYNIKFFTSTDGVIKCAIVERFNRTLRSRIYRYLFHNMTERYIDVLQKIIDSYNNSYHRTIKMTPSQVNNSNVKQVIINIRQSHPKVQLRQKPFKIGDYVYIARGKGIFEKGATRNFQEELFKIVKVKKTPQGYIYKLEDWDGEPITSIFYHYELVKTETKSTYKIDKILKTRINKKTGEKEYFVKWRGYPSKFNSWTNHVEST